MVLAAGILSEAMRRTGAVTVLGIGLLFALTPPVAASESEEEIFQRLQSFIPIWWSNPLERRQETITLGVGESVTVWTMWPDQPLALDADLTDASGKVELSRETVLAGVPGPLLAACEMIRTPGHAKNICLADTDRDGAFDASFKEYGGNGILTEPIQARSHRLKALARPIRYHKLYPAQIAPKVTMVLRFSSRNAKKQESVLEFCSHVAGGHKHQEITSCYYRTLLIGDGGLPVSGSFYNYQYAVTGIEGERLVIRIKRPERPQRIRFAF